MHSLAGGLHNSCSLLLKTIREAKREHSIFILSFIWSCWPCWCEIRSAISQVVLSCPFSHHFTIILLSCSSSILLFIKDNLPFSRVGPLLRSALASFIFLWTKRLCGASFSGISISLTQNHFSTAFGSGQESHNYHRNCFSFLQQTRGDPWNNFCLYARNTSGSSIFVFFGKKILCFLA